MTAGATRPTVTPDAARHSPDVKNLLTSGLARACRYAAARPGCQILASVCYGPVALCAACDQRRSTLGKGTPAVPLPDPHALLRIAAAGDACQHAAAALRHAVAAARQAGHPWSAVAGTPRLHPPGRPAALHRRTPMTAQAPPLAAGIAAGLRRLKLATIRQIAPELLITAKTQRWAPEDLLRTLIDAEITARDASNARPG